jgi:hypothetical protein
MVELVVEQDIMAAEDLLVVGDRDVGDRGKIK